MAALEDAGRLRAQDYKGATMYTTLSPCDMCTGACILYKVKRVVIGFVGRVLKGSED
jgi:cytosine/creatinine deaminase